MKRLVLTLFALAACSSTNAGQSQQQRSFVGDVPTTDIVVGVVATDDEATVYTCGGPNTFDTHSRWFSDVLELEDDAFEFTKDGWTVRGVIGPDSIESGQVVDPMGVELPFAAVIVEDGTVAGLYKKEIDGCKTGLVVTQPSADDDPSGQGTWCDDQGEFLQVIILEPLELTDEGIEVEVAHTDGTKTFFVEPVEL